MTRAAFDSGEGDTSGPGRIWSDTSYGGYARDYYRTVHPDLGTQEIATTGTSANNEVDRYRDLGASMADRPAVQANWGDADTDSAAGAQARGMQDDALALQRNTAQYGNRQAYQYGQNLLDQGTQAQTAGALSARGGPLAQMAALRSAQGGQAAFLQQGNQALEAQSADDKAAGREAYMAGATGQRQGDLQSQYLNQQQADIQAKSEQAQRDLNQQGQQTSEKLGFDVNKQVQDAAIRERSAHAARAETNAQAQDAQDNRARAVVGAGMSVLGGLGAAAATAGSAASDKPKDPSTTSDERMKTVTSLTELAHPSATSDERSKNRTSLTELAHGSQDAGPDVYVPVHGTDQADRVRADDHGYFFNQPDATSGASVSRPAPKYSFAKAKEAAPKAEAAPHKMTDADLKKLGESMLASNETQKEAQLGRGAAVGRQQEPAPEAASPRLANEHPYDSDRGALALQADANRKLQGSAYRYKPGVGEDTGRLHFGPMAQEMEKNPITATAVRTDPQTGIKKIDTGDVQRITLSQLAGIQQQLDEINAGGASRSRSQWGSPRVK